MTYNPVWNQPTQHIPDASGYPVASTTPIDFVVAGVPVSTWESVGPTASGADNIWTALDGVPADANWVELSVRHFGSAGSASINSTSKFYVRQGGTSIGIAHCQVSEIAELMSASGFGQAVVYTTVKVKLGAGKIFDVYWNGDFTNHELDTYLRSYGY